jgi:hypothetical protein
VWADGAVVPSGGTDAARTGFVSTECDAAGSKAAIGVTGAGAGGEGTTELGAVVASGGTDAVRTGFVSTECDAAGSKAAIGVTGAGAGGEGTTEVGAATPAGDGSDGGAADEVSTWRAVGRSSESMILTRAGCVMALRAPVELPFGPKTATNRAVPNNSAAPAGPNAEAVLVQRPERVAGPAFRESCEQGTPNPEVWGASRSRRAGPRGLPGTKAIVERGVAASIGAAPH